MKYLDSNFAAALHFHIEGQTAVAERYIRRTSGRLIFSELAELECRRVFAIRSGQSNSEHWRRLELLLSAATWIREPMRWDTVSNKASDLIDRYGPRLGAGTLDTLHVAQALLCGCAWFLSFDSSSNARVLAASCRLKVFPELTPTERRRLST